MYNFLGEVYRVSYGDLCFLKRHLPETVLSSLAGPVLYLIAFAYGMRAGDTEAGVSYVAYAIPGIVAMTSMTAGFASSSQKIMIQRLFHTSFDELILCPMRTSSIVFGKAVVGMVRGLIGCLIMVAIGLVLTPELFLGVELLAGVFLSCVTFALLGVAAGLLARSSATLNLFSSLVILPMTFLCGTLFSVGSLPDIVGYVVWALPLTHSSEVIRSAALGWETPWVSVAMLVAYLMAFYVLDWYIIRKKLYRWAPSACSLVRHPHDQPGDPLRGPCGGRHDDVFVNESGDISGRDPHLDDDDPGAAVPPQRVNRGRKPLPHGPGCRADRESERFQRFRDLGSGVGAVFQEDHAVGVGAASVDEVRYHGRDLPMEADGFRDGDANAPAIVHDGPRELPALQPQIHGYRSDVLPVRHEERHRYDVVRLLGHQQVQAIAEPRLTEPLVSD